MKTLVETIVLTTAGMWDVAEEPAASTIEFVVREPDTNTVGVGDSVCEPQPHSTTQQPEQSEAPQPPSAAKAATGAAGAPFTRFIEWSDRDWDDPRSDLAEDHAVWAQALLVAHRLDGREPGGCFWVLHGLRGQGGAIEEGDGSPPWRLARGEIDAETWARWVSEYVEPVEARVAWALGEVK